MIVDLATQPAGELPAFDVCIAGAGVAGLTIALQLAARGRRVAVFEAGGRDQSAASQDFYRGANTGIENLPLDRTRLRMLGGSSNHWGGWCRPLDPYDFARTDLTGAAWPISDADLLPYLDKAAAVLGVNAQSPTADLPLADGNGNLQTMRMLFSQPPVHLGDRFYDTIDQTPNLALFLNAAVSMPALDATMKLDAITVRAPAGGAAVTCRATLFVLALGTVENVRMLLLWNRANGDRFANPKLVGRYYMQHLHQSLGQFVVADGAPVPPAGIGDAANVFLSATDDFLRASGVGAFRLYSTEMACGPLTAELTGVTGDAAACSALRTGGELFITCEQMPNAASRIVLIADTDAVGQARADLDWEITERDGDTLRQAALEFGRYLIRANLGRLKVNPVVLAGSQPLAGWSRLPSAPGAAGHQMGGLRMSRTPDDGVTDADCRLWNLDNLYVAGAGVFRTCGHANPTLTLTQLALRLADKLHARLASG